MTASALKELYNITIKIKQETADDKDKSRYRARSCELIQLIDKELSDDMRYAIYYRYILGLGWNRISDICGAFSPDAIRKSCTRTLQKYSSAA